MDEYHRQSTITEDFLACLLFLNRAPGQTGRTSNLLSMHEVGLMSSRLLSMASILSLSIVVQFDNPKLYLRMTTRPMMISQSSFRVGRHHSHYQIRLRSSLAHPFMHHNVVSASAVPSPFRLIGVSDAILQMMGIVTQIHWCIGLVAKSREMPRANYAEWSRLETDVLQATAVSFPGLFLQALAQVS